MEELFPPLPTICSALEAEYAPTWPTTGGNKQQTLFRKAQCRPASSHRSEDDQNINSNFLGNINCIFVEDYFCIFLSNGAYITMQIGFSILHSWGLIAWGGSNLTTFDMEDAANPVNT